jgi:thymidine kinase
MAKLFFYYSAMNAGKTTSLLQSSYNYQERGMNTLTFTPDFDNRYGVGKISSRIGLQCDAYAFARDFNFFDYVAQQKMVVPNLKCILVDEAQFLTKSQVQQLCQIIDELNLPVLCYGLRTDFLGELFEGSACLLGWADELIELKTICHCGRKATMNMRVNEQGQMLQEGAQVEIGGNDRYIALCRKHFFKGHSQPEDKCVIQMNAA